MQALLHEVDINAFRSVMECMMYGAVTSEQEF